MRNNNLKRFLTTASALGMIAIGAQEASAATVVAAPAGAWNASAAQGGNTLNANAGNWVNFNGAGSILTYDNAGTGIIAGAFVTQNATLDIAAGQPVSIGSIVANGGLLAIASGNNAVVTTLTGSAYGTGVGATVAGSAANNYSGLGTVTLANAGAGLTIGAAVQNVTFTNDIIANAGGNGLFVITAGATGNTFTGNIGGGNNLLAGTTVSESVTFAPANGKGAVNLGATTIAGIAGAAKILTVNSTAQAATIRGTIDGNGAVTGALALVAAAGNGVTVSNNVGANNALYSVVANSIGASPIVFSGTTKVDAGGITLNTASTGATTFTGAVTTTNGGNFNAANAAGAVAFNAGALNAIAGTFTSGAGAVTTVNALTVTGGAGVDALTIGAGGGSFGAVAGLVAVTAGNLNASASAAALTFNNGVTVTNGNFKTGAGLVTVAGAATTLSQNATTMTLGSGGYSTNQRITFSGANAPAGVVVAAGAGGVLNLAGNTLTFTAANTISNADIAGTTGSILTGAFAVTLDNTNVSAVTALRGTAATGAASGILQVNNAAGSFVVDGHNSTNGVDVYSTVTNTTGVNGSGSVTFQNTAGAPPTGVVRLHANLGTSSATGALNNVTIGGVGTTAVTLSDNVTIYTAYTALGGPNSGLVNIGAGNASDTLNLGNGSTIVGTLTPAAGGAHGIIGVTSTTAPAKISYINAAVNTLNQIVFNGATGAGNGLFVTAGSLAAPTTGNNINVANGISYTAGATDALAGLTIDLTPLVTTDNNTTLTTGPIGVATAGTGAINFTRTDANTVAQVTLASGGNVIGTIVHPLGAINASGAKILVLNGTGAGYVSAITAPTINITGAASVWGVGLTGATTLNINANTTLDVLPNSAPTIGTSAAPITAVNFTGAVVATVNDTVNIYATNIGTTVNNQGVLTFVGTSTVNGAIGAKNFTLNQININNNNAAAKVVTLQGGDIYSNITFAAIGGAAHASNATILSNVHGFVGNNVANGSVTLTGGTAGITVDGVAGGNGIVVAQATINGAVTMTAGSYNVTATTLAGTLNLGSSTVTPVVTNLGVVTAGTAGAGVINTYGAYATAGNSIGTSTSGIATYNMQGTTAANATLTIRGGDNVYAAITGTNASVVAFTDNGAGASTVGGNIGSTGNALASVTSTSTGTAIVNGDIFAASIHTTGVGGSLQAKNFNTTAATGTIVDANTTAIVADGGSIKSVTGAGNVRTIGSATVQGLANTGIFDIDGTAANSVVTLSDGTVAGVVNHASGTLKLTKATTTGAYTTDGAAGTTATVATAGQSLTTGQVTVAANNTLAITYTYNAGDKGIWHTSVAPVLTGNITVAIDPTTFPTGAIALFDNAGTALIPTGTPANVAITSSKYSSATWAPTTGLITFTTNATKAAVLGSAAQSTDANVTAFGNAFAAAINAGGKGDVAVLAQNNATMTASEQGEWASRTSSHATDASAAQTVAPGVLQTISSSVSNAVANVAAGRINAVSTASTAQGVASGDAAEKFGIWVEALGGVGTQKQRKTLSGFSSNMVGGVLGADTMLNDSATFGILVSNVNNNVKFKDADAGNKSKANSWVFGAYGNYDFSDTNFFAQGNLTVAQTSIKSNSKQLVTGTGLGGAKTYQTAKGKYDILGFGAEVVGGYKFKFDNSYVAPTVGLRYNYFGDTSYTQTGLSAGNQTVKTKATTVVSGLAGVRIGTGIDMDGTMLKPEVHGNLSYAFNAPSSKTSYAINGLQNSLNYAGAKASKFGANFGAGVMAEADGFEYGVGYDANIADKYLAHQGSIKVKVKF